MAIRPTGQASPRIIVRRVGTCIYCRTTADKLANEHVVPAALNGNKVLVAACCETCRVATSKYEHTLPDCAPRRYGFNGTRGVRIKG